MYLNAKTTLFIEGINDESLWRQYGKFNKDRRKIEGVIPIASDVVKHSTKWFNLKDKDIENTIFSSDTLVEGARIKIYQLSYQRWRNFYTFQENSEIGDYLAQPSTDGSSLFAHA